MADGTIGVKTGSLGATSMRYHELALQRWLNRLFIVQEGYPVPVVYATPMDAYSQFVKLWSAANNPFQYLLNAKDEDGTPLYLPHPAPVTYPLLSVYRKGYKYRSYQNFSIHRFRHINWPTVSDDVGKCQLGNVTTSKMPMAWDYRFQIDFFCLRPDTQAFFIEKLMWEFHRNGGTPQTWMVVDYPAWGQQLVRVYIDGDIENSTPEEPEADRIQEFRTTVNIVIEGFALDLNFQVEPALWHIIFGNSSVDPETLQRAFTPLREEDVRVRDNNVTLDARTNVPSDVACQAALSTVGEPFTHHIYIGAPGVQLQYPQTGLPYWPPQPGYPGGIPSSAAFGTPSISQGTVPPTPVSSVSGTDTGGVTPGFHVGSLELAPWTEFTAQVIGLGTGTLFDAITEGGTYTDRGDVLMAFQEGTLMSIIVDLNAGTEVCSQIASFGTGDLTAISVDGGTHVETGGVLSTIYSGTCVQVMITVNGTEFSSTTPSFLEGSLDPA
jgi:hypothetical protein